MCIVGKSFMNQKKSIKFSTIIIFIFLNLFAHTSYANIRVTKVSPDNIILKPGTSISVRLYGSGLKNVPSANIIQIQKGIKNGKKLIKKLKVKGIRTGIKYYPSKGQRPESLYVKLAIDSNTSLLSKGKYYLQLNSANDDGKGSYLIKALKINTERTLSQVTQSLSSDPASKLQNNLQNRTNKLTITADKVNIRPDLAVKSFSRKEHLCKGAKLDYTLVYTNQYLNIKRPVDFKLTVQYSGPLRLPDGLLTRVPDEWSRIIKHIHVNAGQTRQVEFKGIPLLFNAARARISVEIDPRKRIDEHDESNNRLVMEELDLTRIPFCQGAEVNLPDLTIKNTMGFGKSNQSGGACHLLVSIGVENLTSVSSDTTNVFLAVKKTGSNKPAIIKHKTISQIRGHQVARTTFSFSLDEIIGEYGGWDNKDKGNMPLGNPELWSLQFYAEVDHENNIREVFDSNNAGVQAKRFEDVAGRPNLLYRARNGACF